MEHKEFESTRLGKRERTQKEPKGVTMSTKITMSTEEIRQRIGEAYDGGIATAADLRAIETYLDKKEYRENYNRRPEVKARRKAYMATRNQVQKVGKSRLEEVLEALAREKREREEGKGV